MNRLTALFPNDLPFQVYAHHRYNGKTTLSIVTKYFIRFIENNKSEKDSYVNNKFLRWAAKPSQTTPVPLVQEVLSIQGVSTISPTSELAF